MDEGSLKDRIQGLLRVAALTAKVFLSWMDLNDPVMVMLTLRPG